MAKPLSPHHLLASLLLASACLPALASKPPVEAFFNEPEMQSAALSPKGRYVAMLMNFEDGKQVLAVRDTQDLKKITTPATGGGLSQITSFRWINEERLSLTVQNRNITFHGNRDQFAVDRDGSNRTHLISGNWEHQQTRTDTLIRDKMLTADYSFFSATHDGSDDILVAKLLWNGIDKYPDHSRLYRLNTRSFKMSDPLGTLQPPNSLDWLTDARDVPRIVSTQSKGRCMVSYLAPGAASWSEIANDECYDGISLEPLFFDTDDTLYVTSGYKGMSALYRYDLKTRQRAKEPLLSAKDFDSDGSPEIDYLTRRVLGIHLKTDAQTTVWFDARRKAIQAKVDEILPQTNNRIHCADDCSNSPVVLVTAQSDRQPAQFYVYTLASGSMAMLGSAHPGIVAAQMGMRDFYHYQARDGRSIPVYVTMPPDAAPGPHPTVVLVHGGPNVRGSSWEWEAQAQFLATRGYVVLQPEFRGSAGYGIEHMQAGFKQWGQTMQDDLADAALWSVSKGWSDRKHIAIMGASYGGYATLMGLIKNPDIFRCGVEWAGVTDLALMFTANSDASQDSLKYDMRTLIGDPEKDAAMFRDYSPLAQAARLKQPLLMAQGLEDIRVPMVHATKFRDAVKQNNAQVEWVSYTDEGHGWRDQESNLDFWKRVEAFLARNL